MHRTLFGGRTVAETPNTFPLWWQRSQRLETSFRAMLWTTLGSFGLRSIFQRILYGNASQGENFFAEEFSHWDPLS
jgi:hypothetical protein